MSWQDDPIITEPGQDWRDDPIVGGPGIGPPAMAANLRGGVSTPTLEPDQGQIVAPAPSYSPAGASPFDAYVSRPGLSQNPIQRGLDASNARFAQQRQDSDLRGHAAQLDLDVQNAETERMRGVESQLLDYIHQIPQDETADQWLAANPVPIAVLDQFPPDVREHYANVIGERLARRPMGGPSATDDALGAAYGSVKQAGANIAERMGASGPGAERALDEIDPMTWVNRVLGATLPDEQAQLLPHETRAVPAAESERMTRDVAERTHQYAEGVRERNPVDPQTTAGKITAGVVGAAGAIGPVLAASAVPGVGPILAGGMMAADTSGSVYRRVYDELIAQGKSPDEAHAAATSGGAVGYGVGAITGPLMPGGKTLGRGVALGAAGAGLENFAEQEIVKQQTGRPVDPTELAIATGGGAGGNAFLRGAQWAIQRMMKGRAPQSPQPRPSPQAPAEAPIPVTARRPSVQGEEVSTPGDTTPIDIYEGEIAQQRYLEAPRRQLPYEPGRMPDDQLAREALQEAPQPQPQPEQTVPRPPQEEQYSTQQQHGEDIPAHEGSVPKRADTETDEKLRKIGFEEKQIADMTPQDKEGALDYYGWKLQLPAEQPKADPLESAKKDLVGKRFAVHTMRGSRPGDVLDVVPNDVSPDGLAVKVRLDDGSEYLTTLNSLSDFNEWKRDRMKRGRPIPEMRSPERPKGTLPTPRSRIPAQYRPEDLAEAMRGVEGRKAPQAPPVEPGSFEELEAAVQQQGGDAYAIQRDRIAKARAADIARGVDPDADVTAKRKQRATPPRTAPEAPLVAPAEAAPTAAAVTPEPSARVPGARQPWEMTRGEYVGEFNPPHSVRDIQEAEKKAKGARQRHNRRTGAMVPPAISGEVSAKIAGQEASAEEMRQAYREFGEGFNTRTREHYESIADAVRRGKPVPPEVLADYPDLAPKAPGAVTAPPETGQAPAARTFTKGSPVTWTDKGGQEHSGKVIKTAGKMLQVDVGEGRKRLVRQEQVKPPPTGIRALEIDTTPEASTTNLEALEKQAQELKRQRTVAATKRTNLEEKIKAAVQEEPATKAALKGNRSPKTRASILQSFVRRKLEATPEWRALDDEVGKLTAGIEDIVDARRTAESEAETLSKESEQRREEEFKAKIAEYPWWEIEREIKRAEANPPAGASVKTEMRGPFGQRYTDEEPTDIGSAHERRIRVMQEALEEKLKQTGQRITEVQEGEVLPKGYEPGRGLEGLGIPDRPPPHKGLGAKKLPLEKELKALGGSEVAVLKKRGEVPPDLTTIKFSEDDAVPFNTRNEAKDGIQKLKQFLRVVPEFALDPHLTVTEDGRLRFKDGGTYTFESPQAVGIVALRELKPGERIRIDVEAVKKFKGGEVLGILPETANEQSPPAAKTGKTRPGPTPPGARGGFIDPVAILEGVGRGAVKVAKAAATVASELTRPIRAYARPFITKMRHMGGKVGQKYADTGLRMASMADELYAQSIREIDSARDAVRKPNITTRWLMGVENEIDGVGQRRIVGATEGNITNVPTAYRPTVSQFRVANRAIGDKAAQFIASFSPTGKFQRNMTEYGVNLVTGPYNATKMRFVKWLMAKNGKTESEVRGYLDQLADKLLTNDYEGATRTINQEFRRVLPQFPTSIKDGGWQDILHAQPDAYLRRANRITSSRAAFLSEFPDQGSIDRARSEIRQNGGDVSAFDEMIRGIHEMPSDTGLLGKLAPAGTPTRRAANVLMDALSIRKGLSLSGAALANSAELLIGSTPLALGFRNSLRGWLKVFTRGQADILEAQGLIDREMYDWAFDPTQPTRSVVRTIRNAISMGSLNRALNELTEKHAAATLDIVEELALDGKLSGGTKSRIEQVARAMDFSEADAKAIVNGHASAAIYDAFKRRGVTFLTGGKRTGIASTPFQMSRTATELFPFQSYGVKQMNQLARYTENIARAIKEKKPGEAVAAARLWARFAAGTTAQGAAIGALMAMVGGAMGLSIFKNEAEDEPAEFLMESFLNGLAGPAAVVYRFATSDESTATKALGTVYPASVAGEFSDMIGGTGIYRNQDFLERAKTFATRKVGGGRILWSVIAPFAFTGESEAKEIDGAIRGYYRWKGEEVGRERHEQTIKNDKEREALEKFHTAMRSATEEMKRGKMTEAMEELNKAVGAKGDPKAVAQSLRARRLLADLEAQEHEQLKKRIGQKAYDKLVAYDQVLEGWAEAVSPSRRRGR